MNQYGYIPFENIHLLQQTYSIANPSTWTFSKAGELFGGVEESEFSHLQKDEITSLGGEWFENATAFSLWFNS